jgi:threonylcarbamoyladenosine tRNA methylthiotransferase MtaB
MAELLEDLGFSVVPFEEAADVYVVNTCTVTGRSDYRSRQMLRRAARTNPEALVVATGCYAQREPEALAAMPEVGLVVGNTAKHRIGELVAEALSAGGAPDGAGTPTTAPAHGAGPFEPLDIARFRGYTRAFVKIQDGCDRDCAYCAVPAARGPARSRPFADVVRQTSHLASNGYREVVLTGVHIGAYSDGGRTLADLLRALSGIDELARIRLGSVEPREMTAELADSIASEEKVCLHLHVPLQSGSDAVLERMGRGYTAAEYAEAVRRVTDGAPSCGLGTDVMVGFPGETEADFDSTAALIEELPFTYLHVFAFSPRRGTRAASLGARVPGVESKRRSNTLRELGRRKSLDFRSGMVGHTVEILVEKGSRSEKGRLTGLTENYVRVETGGDATLVNRLVGVEIRGADEKRTWGSLVEKAVR